MKSAPDAIKQKKELIQNKKPLENIYHYPKHKKKAQQWLGFCFITEPSADLQSSVNSTSVVNKFRSVHGLLLLAPQASDMDMAMDKF